MAIPDSVSNLQQFVYVLKPNRIEMLTAGPTPAEAGVLSAHVEYLERLAGEGAVLLAGRTQTKGENTFGIVIIRAGSEREARHVMDNDPAVLGGVMGARLFPYRIAVLSPALAEGGSDDRS
jgi:uncharacterized protein YciI